MRSSSMKSLSVVTALVVALAAVPRAEAKTTQPRNARTTLAQLFNRLFGLTTQEDFPSDPKPNRDASTSTITTVETSPKKIK